MKTAQQFQWIASFTLFAPSCGISYQDFQIGNVQIYVKTLEIGNVHIGNVQIGNVQIGNKKLGNAEIGRMEWPSLAIVSDAAMDICKCNQVQLVGTSHTG